MTARALPRVSLGSDNIFTEFSVSGSKSLRMDASLGFRNNLTEPSDSRVICFKIVSTIFEIESSLSAKSTCKMALSALTMSSRIGS